MKNIILISILLSIHQVVYSCYQTHELAIFEYHKSINELRFEDVEKCATQEAKEEYIQGFERVAERASAALQNREYIRIPFEKYKSGSISAGDFYIELNNRKNNQWASEIKETKKIKIVGFVEDGKYTHVLYRFDESESLFQSIRPRVFTLVKESGLWKYGDI